MKCFGTANFSDCCCQCPENTPCVEETIKRWRDLKKQSAENPFKCPEPEPSWLHCLHYDFTECQKTCWYNREDRGFYNESKEELK